MNTKINQLLEYALKNGMIEEYDYDYSANLLIDLFGIYEFKREEVEDCSIYEILDFMLDYAVEKGMIQDTVTEKDLLDTRIMNCLMPRPSEVIQTFKEYYKEDSKKADSKKEDNKVSTGAATGLFGSLAGVTAAGASLVALLRKKNSK